MNEVLTRAEIKSQFDGEWVLVEDPELTPQLEVLRGRVLYHSQNRDDVYQKGIELRPRHTSIWGKCRSISTSIGICFIEHGTAATAD